MSDVVLYAWCDDPDKVEEYMLSLARDGAAVLEDGGRALRIQGANGQYRVAAKGRIRRAPKREA
jgi:hypothetical protein